MKIVRSSPIVLLIMLVISAFALVNIISLQPKIAAKEAEVAALTEQITETEQENERLTEAIENANTSAGVESIARSKLGFVTEGEVVFYDGGN